MKKILFVLLLITSCQKYSKATLERKSRSGYNPTEYTTVMYSDSMAIGKRVWYDCKMWTVIKLK